MKKAITIRMEGSMNKDMMKIAKEESITFPNLHRMMLDCCIEDYKEGYKNDNTESKQGK